MKLYTLALFFFSIPFYPQIVCDGTTKEPIPSVNISNESGAGTITNDRGLFSIDYFESLESLNFSHLTYNSKNLSAKEAKTKDTIFLTPLTINLNEVIVINFNVQDTIIKVIHKIPINYSFEQHNLFGFYRESIKEDNKGAALTEASFVTYNRKGRNKSEVYEAEIVQGRRTENHTSLGLDIIGGVVSILQESDMVRHKQRMFDINNLSKYKFQYLGSIGSGKDQIYTIGFEPATNDIYNNDIGKLYIDSRTLAIIQIETKKDKEKVKHMIEALKPDELASKDALFMLLEASGVIKYREIDNKYFLSFIDINNSKKGVKKDESYHYDINVKYILTNLNTSNPRKLSTNYNLNKGFNEQVREIPKLADWEESNILFFSDDERKILNDIKNYY